MNYMLKKIEKKIYINNCFYNYYYFFIFKKKVYLFHKCLSFNFFLDNLLFIKKYLKESGFIK